MKINEATIRPQLEAYGLEKIKDYGYVSTGAYMEGFTDCLNLLMPIVEACDHIYDNQHHLSDTGMVKIIEKEMTELQSKLGEG